MIRIAESRRPRISLPGRRLRVAPAAIGVAVAAAAVVTPTIETTNNGTITDTVTATSVTAPTSTTPDTFDTCAAPCPDGTDARLEFHLHSLPRGVAVKQARLQVNATHGAPATVVAEPDSPHDTQQPLDTVNRVRAGVNSWDVSPLVTGNGTYRIRMRQQDGSSPVQWASPEADPELRPRLVVTYTPPEPTPPATPAAAAPTTPHSPPATTPAAPDPTLTPGPASPGPTGSSPPESPGPTSPPPGCDTISAKLVPACGAWWGMYSPSGKAMGWDHAAPITAIENQTGRRIDVVHRYHDFSNAGSNGAFPDIYQQAQMAEGRVMFFAWESRVFATGTTYTWADVYSGRHDATIDAVAKRIRDTGVPVFISFDHEPEDDPGKGSDADFARAWRYVHDRFTAAGATNAVWVWTVMGWHGYYHRYADLYPGDEYVDWIGYDPYNFYACNGNKTWKSPTDTIAPFYRWLDDTGLGAGKPRMLAEYGTNFDPADPLAKQRWFEQFPAAVKAHPKIKAVVYFNSAGSTTTGPTCNMLMNDTPEALAGFIAAGNDLYFQQPPLSTALVR